MNEIFTIELIIVDYLNFKKAHCVLINDEL